MADLHEQIRTAVEARKERAEAATGGRWTMRDGWGPADDGLMRCTRIANDQHATVIGASEADGVMSVDLLGRREDFEHIAAEDPATVLRQVARDLRVLERHRAAYDTGAMAELKQDPWCFACRFGRPFPCPEVLELAEAYGIEVES